MLLYSNINVHFDAGWQEILLHLCQYYKYDYICKKIIFVVFLHVG